MQTDILRSDAVVKILGGRVILYDISLEIMKGEILGLIGPSGSGKTTFLRTLCGFFVPERGDVLVRSSFIGRKEELYTSVSKDLESVKKVFGFASQHPSIYMELSARENLLYFAALQGLSKDRAMKSSKALLELMELDAAKNTKGKDLSGGMQRRLDIACAMIHNPKVLILDEPTADLDPFLRRHIWDIIQKINAKGTTVLVSSHELSDVERICDRVALLHQGKLLMIDDAKTIKERFASTDHIMLQTFPGDYDNLIQQLHYHGISQVERVGQELVIATRSPETDLNLVLSAVQARHESLTSIRVESARLDQVFIQLSEEMNQ